LANAGADDATSAGAVTLAYNVPFADYDNYVYSGTPSIPDYAISAGLSNVGNLLQFSADSRDWTTSFGFWHSPYELSAEAAKLIERNGFAVSDKYSHNEFFQLYENNRYQYVPNFITTDSAVHTFHLMFDYVLKDLEQKKLYGLLAQLSNGMAAASYRQYKELSGTAFETAALRNAAFFSVGSKLLDSGFAVPPEAAGAVSQELALIDAKAGIAASPTINLGGDIAGANAYMADYTQYITRSHYNQTEQLQAYFRAMMWYGQLTFRSSSEDEVKSALLQTSALSDPELSALWAGIFEPTNFFVGECDDITHYQYAGALKYLYGPSLGSTASISDESKFGEALAVVRRMPPPRINSVPAYEIQDKDAAAAGYREAQRQDALSKGGGGAYDFNYSFRHVAPYISAADYAIGNLETTISLPGNKPSDFPAFGAPPSFAEAIKAAGFDLLATANNHALDFGKEGAAHTLGVLDALGLEHTGTYATEADSEKITVIDVNGIKFAILSYTHSTNGNTAPQDSPWLVNMADAAKSCIARAKELNPDAIIVMPHMGAEYETATRPVFKDMVYELLQAGADIVLATHPHVLQPAEFITVTDEDGTERNCFAAYSMGNFISSQRAAPRDYGMIANLGFSKHGGGKATLDSVGLMPVWVKFSSPGALCDITVLPVSELGKPEFAALSGELSEAEAKRIEYVKSEFAKMFPATEMAKKRLSF
jgi:hypothetical protein